MTERGRRHVSRQARHFQVGPSHLEWRDDRLRIHVDEVSTPWPQRVRGRIDVFPQALCSYVSALDVAQRHHWGPIAPVARAEVTLDSPSLRWQGHAYLDSNEGAEPIDTPFETWDWMRSGLADGSTVVAYDVQAKNSGDNRLIGVRFDPSGGFHDVELPQRHALTTSAWGVKRSVRSLGAAGGAPHGDPAVLRRLEDTPFYARSLVKAQLLGQTVEAVHETFCARRFASPWVQALLPWRMPRRP